MRESRNPPSFTVRGIIEQGGLAGDAPTLLLSLSRTQQLFGRDGQINYIAVSNIGDERTGVDVSEEVTDLLRVRFADPKVSAELKDLLAMPGPMAVLESETASRSDEEESDIARLVRTTPRAGSQR